MNQNRTGSCRVSTYARQKDRKIETYFGHCNTTRSATHPACETYRPPWLSIVSVYDATAVAARITSSSSLPDVAIDVAVHGGRNLCTG